MTQQIAQKPVHPESHRASRTMPWILVSAAVAVLVALALWFVFSEDAQPTVTFDGQTATYDGPTTFDAGEVTFTFDGSEYERGVAFVIVEVIDDDITLEDFKAWAAENPARSVPPFGGTIFVATTASGDQAFERTVTLEADTRYGVSANTSPTDTDQAHPVVVIEVN